MVASFPSPFLHTPTLAGKGAAATPGVPLDPEEALLAEMASVKEKMESRLKREKKHRREMKKKAKIRALQVGGAGGRGWDRGCDPSLVTRLPLPRIIIWPSP